MTRASGCCKVLQGASELPGAPNEADLSPWLRVAGPPLEVATHRVKGWIVQIDAEVRIHITDDHFWQVGDRPLCVSDFHD